ncbi:Asp-tRNA(Asn)/Glu-tRNA(Gln) amidotransferase subunit GatC [Novispirillum sp. DQ9]|uniref:Asp-tRNA(Asn)/Glu-tRNA(Gln) amidotransferase subunit GatC n=1 Tax=Novispirillum sp. DQ9 TaxID=3398612 RepID=UPI003C7E30FB
MLDKTTVRNIAFLARIDVPDADLEPLAHQLSGILDWVEQLQEVNTDGVHPMSSVTEMTLPWRADDVTDGGYRDKVTVNAPGARDGFFAVPKVVE